MKKVKIEVHPEELARAVGLAYTTVQEHDGERPVLVMLGTIGDIVFELGAYNADKMIPESAEDDGIYLEMDNPVIGEQLNLYFGEENGTIH